MIDAPRHPAARLLSALSLMLLAAGAEAAEPDPALTICCQDDAGNVQYTTPRACKGMGGVQVSDDLCREVCCVLPDGTTVTTTLADCRAQGGGVAPAEECHEICDCKDNDGDGAIDEDYNDECYYEGKLVMTADDEVTGLWVDGVPHPSFPSGGETAWTQTSSYVIGVWGMGPHTLAYTAEDVQFVAQGAKARVQVPGITATYDTGFGGWLMSHLTPPAGWQTTGAGLVTPDDAALCFDTSPWGGIPAALAAAAWVWEGGCDPAMGARRQHAITTFRACVAKVCCVDPDGNQSLVDADACPAGAEVPIEECRGVACEPIQCPPSPYYPVDTDGDGCDDDCWVAID